MKDIYAEEQDAFEYYIAESNNPLVIFVVNNSPGLKYGVGTYLQQIVTVFRDSKKYDFIVLVAKAYIGDSQTEFKLVDNVAYYYIPTNNLDNKKYYTSIYYFLLTRIRTERKIILHCNYASQLPLAELFKECRGVSLLYTQHYMDWCIRYGPDFESAKSEIQKNDFAVYKFREEQSMMSLADLILVSARHSHVILESVYKIDASKIKILPLTVIEGEHKNDIALLKRKYNLTSNQRIILYVGRLDENKGVSSLIQAFSHINNRDNVYLWIVGDGDFSWCMKYVNNKNWSKITFWGFQPRETILEMYAIAEVGVVPSVYEEFGLVALEMMRSGLPIIARDTTGLNDITENGSWGDLFSDSDDGNSLMNVLERRLTKPFTTQFKHRLSLYIDKKYHLSNYSKTLYECYDMLSNNASVFGATIK